MNKVVIREMRASELPASVRGDIAGDHVVEVTVRDLDADPTAAAGHFSRHFAKVRQSYASVGEIVEHVRRVRDGED